MRAATSFLVLAACASAPASKPVSTACPQPAAPAAPATPAAPAVAPVQPTPGVADAMAKLSFLRGEWAGSAVGTTRTGERYNITQTERVGAMLGGDVLVIEGRGYRDDGSTEFNAFAVVSWDQRTQKYEMRSYTQGHAGTFELKLTDGGFSWEVPAGPGASMRFTATVKDGMWREIGEYVAGDKLPARMFEMDLRRIGDSERPLGTPVSPSAAKR